MINSLNIHSLCAKFFSSHFCLAWISLRNYRIGIDWDHNGVSYLQTSREKINILLSLAALFLTQKLLMLLIANVVLVTDSLGIRLKSPTVVKIPPHNIANDTIRASFQSSMLHKLSITKLFKVIGNTLSSIEQPYLLILHILHKFDTRYHEQCVTVPVYVGDEDIILNKGMTLCFVQETDLATKIPHIKEMDTVNIAED